MSARAYPFLSYLPACPGVTLQAGPSGRAPSAVRGRRSTRGRHLLRSHPCRSGRDLGLGADACAGQPSRGGEGEAH